MKLMFSAKIESSAYNAQNITDLFIYLFIYLLLNRTQGTSKKNTNTDTKKYCMLKILCSHLS